MSVGPNTGFDHMTHKIMTWAETRKSQMLSPLSHVGAQRKTHFLFYFPITTLRYLWNVCTSWHCAISQTMIQMGLILPSSFCCTWTSMLHRKQPCKDMTSMKDMYHNLMLKLWTFWSQYGSHHVWKIPGILFPSKISNILDCSRWACRSTPGCLSTQFRKLSRQITWQNPSSQRDKEQETQTAAHVGRR